MIPNKFSLRGSIFCAGLFLVLILMASCEKEPSSIGLNIQPISDKPLVSYFDSVTVEAYTLQVDSVRADETTFSVLGNMVDPVFGFTDASFMTQITLSSVFFYPGENPQLDSAMLYLAIDDYYGAENTTFTLNVYEVIEPFDYDSTYYSNFDPTNYVGTLKAGTATFTPSDTLVPVKIYPFVSEKLIGDSAALSSYSNFMDHFYGFYITTERVAGDGSLVNFNLLSEDSRVEVFYSNDAEDSLSYNYVINGACARINLFNNDLSEADPALKIQHTGTAVQDSVVYVQGLSGVETYLHFPAIENWTDRIPGGVNKAVLEIPVESDDPTATLFEPAPRLTLYAKDEDGGLVSLSDKSLGDDYFGGYYDKQDNLYRFNITDFYRGFLLGSREDIDLYVRLDSFWITPGRVVLSSGSNSRPIKLKISYTAF